MIPWQAPNGYGLTCQECHQAHQEIQSELKALEETSAEPGILGAGGTPRESRRGPLPQPASHCALCGEEFPLLGPVLPCKSCEYRLRQGSKMTAEMKAQEEISSPRRDTLPEPQDNRGPTDSPSGIPEASRACPGPDPGALTLANAHPALTRPFPINLVEVKPGSLNQEKTRALALAYVDIRAYQARLDEVVGPDGWSIGIGPLAIELSFAG